MVYGSQYPISAVVCSVMNMFNGTAALEHGAQQVLSHSSPLINKSYVLHHSRNVCFYGLEAYVDSKARTPRIVLAQKCCML